MEKRPSMRSIKKFFNDVARQPALKFEVETGLTGIAGRYVFPKGFHATKYEDFYAWKFFTPVQHPAVVIKKNLPDRERMDRGEMGSGLNDVINLSSPAYKKALKNGWLKLKKLNPQLEAVKLDENNYPEIYNALLGVTSGFNVNDINFYMQAQRDGHFPGAWSRSIPDMGAMRDFAESETGTYIGWVASRETLQSITKQLGGKPPKFKP